MHVRWVAPETHFRRAEVTPSIHASGDLTRSVHTLRLEAEARRIQGRVALAVSSGTAAIWSALLAVRSRRAGAIVVPAFGFPATARMAASTHGRLRVADVGTGTPTIDVDQAADLARDPAVAGVVVIDYLDSVVDCAGLRQGLPERCFIVEDAAGSWLSADANGRAVDGGDVAAVSLHVSKVVGGGEGGLVFASDPTLLGALARIRDNGLEDTVHYRSSGSPGMNIRITEAAAAASLASLRTADERIAKRHVVRRWYDERLDELTAGGRVSRVPGRTAGSAPFGPFVLAADERDFVLAVLRANGVEARAMWCGLVTEDKSLAGAVEHVPPLPNAHWWRDHILVLPVHELMTELDVDRIVSLVERCLR